MPEQHANENLVALALEEAGEQEWWPLGHEQYICVHCGEEYDGDGDPHRDGHTELCLVPLLRHLARAYRDLHEAHDDLLCKYKSVVNDSVAMERELKRTLVVPDEVDDDDTPW